MCGKKTDKTGKTDAVSRLDCDWEAVTWDSVWENLNLLEELWEEGRKPEPIGKTSKVTSG